MTVAVIICEFVTVYLLLTALLLISRGNGTREEKMMNNFLCASLAHNVGYMLELTAPTLAVCKAALKFENVSSIFVPLCFTWFIFGYCFERPPRKLLYTLTVIDALLLPFLFFCDSNTLLYQSFAWEVTASGYHYVSLTYGPLYYPVQIVRILLPYGLSLYAVIQAILKRNREDNIATGQYVTMLSLSALPLIAFAAYALKFTDVYDFSPLATGLCLALISILVWSKRDYDFQQVAAEAVIGSMSDGVVALDARRRIVNFNKAAEAIFYTDGTQPGQYKVGDCIDEIPGYDPRLLDESEPRSFTRGNRSYESHAKRILDKNGVCQGYSLLFLDMTDTNEYIDEIKRVRYEAERANIAKSEFLANMSHEIRTPMNAISGLSEIVMEECRGRKVYTYARDIKQAAGNLLSIINDILDLSKIEAGKMDLVPDDYHIIRTVTEVTQMMDMAASKKGLQLRFEYDSSLPCGYWGDAGRIKQILINLLNNAIKFTTEGYVRISLDGRPGENPDEEILYFHVEDTGCGIKEEDQAKIFDNFTQVDARRNRTVEGTGLGLSITKNLLEMMGGDISLHSIPGIGSTFTVTLPQRITDKRTIEEAGTEVVEEAEEAETFVAPGLCVLVVDDNPVNLKVANSFLQTYEFDIDDASGGPEAIEMVTRKRYDIIFMDHMMPQMDGIEATETIRRECGEYGTSPVIIALTANAMSGMRDKFLAAGFQDYVPKPLDRKELNECLLRWVPPERREKATAARPWEERFHPEMFLIYGVDPEAAASHFAGNDEDYVELLQLFTIEGRHKLGLLARLHEEGDLDTYQVEVHGLKSAAANIGAVELSKLARDHEMAANAGDTSYIDEHIDELATVYRDVLDNVKAALDDLNTQAAAGERPELLRDEAIAGMHGVLERIQNFEHREALLAIEALVAHHMDPALKSQLQEVWEHLKLYEDDAAEQQLEHIIAEYELPI